VRRARVSVDTQSGLVARGALAAGAAIINDVSMGSSPELLEAVAQHGAELVLMHRRSDGRCEAPFTEYADVVDDVLGELEGAVDRAMAHGVSRSAIWIDPGIGFSKTAEQSARLLGSLERFVATGQRVLVGASRKNFIAALSARPGEPLVPSAERLGGSLAVVLRALEAGVTAVRVHDVAASRQAALIAHSMKGAPHA
jgi:dihydropteroate synthase